MASTYSSNLRLELIATGEKSGTWGDVTNTNLGTLLEEAIGGYIAVTVTDGADTVLTTNNGLADQARNMTLNLTGTLTAARNVIVPAIEKIYVVKNSTSGGFSVTVKVSGQTGVTIPNGATMLVFVDGTDVRQAGAAIGASNTIELGTLADTTITRSAAGVIAVEGGVVPLENRANTFTANQRIDANVGIGASPGANKLYIQDATSAIFALAGDSTALISAYRNSTDTSSSQIQMYKARGSTASRTIVASGDITGRINFFGYDGASNLQTAEIRSSVDATPGTNDMPGNLTFYTTADGASTVTERMRIDASGNVGIGITPSAWSGLTALQIKGASIASSTRELSTQGNAYYNSGWKYIDTAAASQYLQSAGVHYWYTAASGTAGSAITFTERMRLDASGNLGIGGAPSYALDVKATTGQVSVASTTGTNYARYLVQNTGGTIQFGIDNSTGTNFGSGAAYSRAIFSDGAYPICVYTNGLERMRIDANGAVVIGTNTNPNNRRLRVNGSGSGNTWVAVTDIAQTSNEMMMGLDPTNALGYVLSTTFPIAFSVNGAERMRIDSSGNVGIGTASPAYKLDVSATGISIGARIQTNQQDATISFLGNGGINGYVRVGASDNNLVMTAGNAERMRITAGGEVYIAGTTDQGAYNLQCNGTGVWGAGAYVNGSDARIKDDIAPIGSCLDIVASLNPVTFKYKEDWSKDQSVQPGFIAQELQASLGNTNYVDGVVMQGPEYMSVAYQSLIPVLTKALQEALTEINSLKARIDALEAA